MKAVVIGAGSVGFGHLRYAIERYGFCGVVDINPEKFVAAEKEFPGQVRCFSNLDNVFLDEELSKDALFVVSNLGPDHMGTVKKLVQHGVRKIYVEKPMAVSIADCHELERIQKEADLRIVVGFQRRESGLAQAVQDLSLAHCGGLPTSLVVHGGALDMSTNGIHWLDFAADLFQARPQAVSGSGTKEQLNPRRSDLLFWDGVLTWVFQGGRRLTVVFDNNSSVGPTILAYSRHGTIDLSSGIPVVRTRKPEEVELYPSVTRYGVASEEISPESGNAELSDGRVRLFDALDGDGDLTSVFEESSFVTSALLAGLWAIQSDEIVQLPVGPKHPSFFVEWPAS